VVTPPIAEEHELSPSLHELTVYTFEVDTVESPVVVITEREVIKVAEPVGVTPLLTGVTDRDVGTIVVDKTSIRVVSDPILAEQAVSELPHELTV
jgi:hypothetical protein